MDVDIENMVHRCKGCALAAKAPPIVHKPWPKTDHPWTRLHIDFAGPVEDYYYLIVVDSFTKWPEVLRCKKPTSNTTTTFLHELFARFGVPECIVSDNGTQFTSEEFKEFCELYQINHITTPPYHPRSNGLAERFVDTLKRALKKASGVPTEKALQQFLQVYRITPNQRTQSNMAPAELMFARKVKSVFDKLLPGRNRIKNTMYTARKRYTPGEKVFFKCYRNNIEFWERGIVDKRIGDLIYIIKGPKNTHKRHQNQLKKCYVLEHEESIPDEEEDPIDVMYDIFQVEPPQSAPEPRRSGRKRKFTDPLDVNPKRKRY